MPVERVTVVTGDTRRFKYAVGTFASRAAVSGNAVALAAGKVRAKALRIAAEALETDPGDRKAQPTARSRSRRAPEREIALETVAVLANPLRYAFDEQTRLAAQFVVGQGGGAAGGRGRRAGAGGDRLLLAAARPPSPTACTRPWSRPTRRRPRSGSALLRGPRLRHADQPRIDGEADPGGVAQGVGGALYERMVYDENGQLLNASFMGHPVRRTPPRCPRSRPTTWETPSPLNPLGVKGAGEAGTIAASAVLAAAISDTEGFFVDRMPISPSELWALRERQRRKEG